MYATISEDGSITQCDVMAWSSEFQRNPLVHYTKGGRQVARNEIEPNILVSTVFLGMDHGWGDEQLWFETMIFWPGSPLDEEQWRYPTVGAAYTGHFLAIQKVFAALAAEGS